MNIFLNNLVSLNQIILHNASQQFPEVSGSRMRYRAAPAMQEDDLLAAVCTEIVSGETRYQIETNSDGTSWTLALWFTLSQPVPSIPWVVLSFSTLDNPEELQFDQVMQTETPNCYWAKLHLDKLEQRDALLRALSDLNSQTTLVVAITTDHSITNTITDPKTFFFPKDYYAYIYRGLLPPPPRWELLPKLLEYQHVWYNYYQDYNLKNYLYYLPNTFEPGTDASGKPMLSYSFSAPEDATSLDQVRVTFDYFLLPKVIPGRIANALEQFLKEQPDGRLIPFASADTLTLELELPAGKTEEKNAIINLQSGVADSFTLPAAQFVTIWDALFSGGLLLRGELVVQFTGLPPDRLPVKITLDSQYKSKPLDFLTQTTPVYITTTLTFKSSPGTYSASGPRPVASMLVSIDGQTIELDEANPTRDVKVKTSVIERFIDPNWQPTYEYSLEIHYVDGGKVNRDHLKTQFEIIYVP